MKFAKKMIMIPEVEYMTLMNMIKGENPLLAEKAQTDTKITKLLQNRNLSEADKAHRYQWLAKQRKQLKNEIKNESEKPQKVVLDEEQIKTIENAVGNSAAPKYLGVAPTPSISKLAIAPIRTVPAKRVRKIIRRRKMAKNNSEGEFVDASDEQIPPPEMGTFSSKQYIIHPNYRDDFLNILKGYSAKLNSKEKTVGGIKGSNVEDIVDYLTNTNLKKPAGTDFLVNTLKNEAFYKRAINWAKEHKQMGDGVRRKKSIKAVTAKKFKPSLWIRL